VTSANETISKLIQSVFRGALGQRLPLVDGEVRAPGIRRPVRISRDAHGVPSIVAENAEDAWFGLGFCHGQDRAGQLEILIRTVRGTLAEIAGADAVPIDRLSRRIGFRRAARAQLASARPEVRAQLHAYARGVNAGTSKGSPSRAHDLLLFGCDATPFEAEDAQGIMIMLCFALAANWDVELLRLEILRRDGARALRLLDASYPEHLPTSLPPFAAAGPSADRLEADLDALRTVFPLTGASNAWAVDGSRTKSKKPILAADPHLEPVVPPHWYLAHVVTPGWRVRGASFMGVPGFAIGHNERVAWGVTAAHADNTDLFLEEVGPGGRTIREGDAFVPCEERLEAIAVKGEDTIVERVLVTPRGPLVGAAFSGAGIGISISATWLSSRPYTGLLLAHEARDARAIQELFREASASSVCVVSADVDGHIGWRLAVEIPRRRRGHGTIPLPGWEPNTGFLDEPVAFDELPATLDPKEGFVATANNAPAPRGDVFLGVDWLDGYHHRSIVEALAARSDWDLDATLALQKDVRSIPWEELRAHVLAAPRDGDAGVGIDLLSAWDGRMAPDAIGASVYALFIAKLTAKLVAAAAPTTARRVLGEGFNPILPHNTLVGRRLGHVVRTIRERPDGVFEEGWPRAMSSALAEAIAMLRETRGPESARWAWGEVRPLRLVHLFSRVNPLLDRIFGLGPFPGRGDSSTIVQGAVDLLDPTSTPLGVPNLRVVVDLADLGASRFSMLGGQSGNPTSPLYRDQIDAFEGGGLRLAWTDDDVRRLARHELAVVPA
jgi:penicillin amidase